MSEAARPIEPDMDTARVPVRSAASGPRPVQQPAPPDPVAELAKPLDALPKFETHHTFKLSRPVQSPAGQTYTEVRLRVPTGMDLFEVQGPPTKTIWGSAGMMVEMDSDRFRKWLSRLASDGVDVPTLYRASARDLRAMYEWLNTELNPAGN